MKKYIKPEITSYCIHTETNVLLGSGENPDATGTVKFSPEEETTSNDAKIRWNLTW